MVKIKNLTGIRFGRQVAIKSAGKNDYGNILWLCECDCGNRHIVPSGKLVQGKSKSCGCIRKENGIKMLEKHGITTGGKPRTLIIWSGMKARCLNPKSVSYSTYGGRGIGICDEWLSFENFHNWAIASGYKETLTIDRINPNGNYEPLNCRWIGATENKKMQRSARYISIHGEAKNVSDWCKETHISKATAYKHINISEEDFANFIEGQQYFTNKFLNCQLCL